jgi:hypothetical protein
LLPVPYVPALAERYFPATLTHQDYPKLVSGSTINTLAVGTVLGAYNGRRRVSVTNALPGLSMRSSPGLTSSWCRADTRNGRRLISPRKCRAGQGSKRRRSGSIAMRGNLPQRLPYFLSVSRRARLVATAFGKNT